MPIKRVEPKPRTSKGYAGKSTKLSITRFVDYLFELNEQDPPEGVRLKDEDIIESVKSEFGTKPITVRKIADPNSNASLSSKRARYNKLKPALLSIRYDHNQFPCRNYDSHIDIDELRRRAWRYGIIDPRLFTIDEIKLVIISRENNEEIADHFQLPSKEMIAAYPFGSIQFAPGYDRKPTTRINPETLELT